MRTEKDLIGTLALPDSVLYGINTKRAAENFDLGIKKTDEKLVHAIVLIKKAAALTYEKLAKEESEKEIYRAVVTACDQVLNGRYQEFFVTEALQGGAGTSANMNVNEVIANAALLILGDEPGNYKRIHPLDTINRGQSTNDVYPTALRIAAIAELEKVSKACEKLQTALQEKENEFDSIKKLGRTELMDAVPVTLGMEFGSFAQAISRDRWRLYKCEERLRVTNLGGTAVGTSDTASKKYRFGVIEELRQLTGYGLAQAEYPMDMTQNQDVFVEVSGLLKTLAVNLLKISNDLRLMASGPDGGFGEIRLKQLQQGSTIMPGKVNPVICEMVMQCAMKVIANDTAITMAAQHGEFELNAFLPLIADSLLESLTLCERSVTALAEKCIKTIAADVKKCEKHLNASIAFAASFVPVLGYDLVSKTVHENENEKAKKLLSTYRDEILLIDKLAKETVLTREEFTQLLKCENETVLNHLYEKARRTRESVYGKDVYLRGLIEFTSYCKNNCYYCGLQRENHKAKRYRLSKEEILACCRNGYELGFRTFVLQGGEDAYYTDEILIELIKEIKKEFSDCALTLSIGEKDKKSYEAYFKAGADRYLLREETANEAHYQKLHPKELSFSHRMQCLFDLKEIGYQVGCGFMIGSPYQTPDHVIDDLLFMKKLQPHMIGIGPFIPHKDTRFADCPAGTVTDTLRLIAVLRLMFPHALIPATTALGTIDQKGREKGLLAGANVIMPNLSPKKVREKYLLYDGKICTGEEAAECKKCMERRVESCNYHVVSERGDYR